MVAWLQVINRALGQDLWASPGTYSPWSPPWGPRFCSSFAARGRAGPPPPPPLRILRDWERKKIRVFRGKQPFDFIDDAPISQRYVYQFLSNRKWYILTKKQVRIFIYNNNFHNNFIYSNTMKENWKNNSLRQSLLILHLISLFFFRSKQDYIHNIHNPFIIDHQTSNP